MPYDCVLKPGEVARIPLGFGLIIPDGFAGYVFPRSSMAAKGLVCELPPIDSGYRGEIHAIISNVSTSSQIIHKDTRVGQLVITPVVIADFVLDLGEERGTGLLEAQENNTMITFGRKLKHLRQKNHLTQKELGIAVGFPYSCADVRIAQYEGDVRTPKEDLMKLFASTLGVPVELFTVPVLSEPREYEAAEYWRYELGAELD